jgi:DNA polymerase III alpha subunit
MTVHLRIRTEYSFGNTFAPIDRVVERLKQIGCTAAGIVDKASTWGHVPWYNACKAAGIQPMLGLEMVVDDEDNPVSMWFLATNKASLSELYRSASKAHQQPLATKYGSVPRLFRRDVLRMSDGIIKFAGEISDGAFLAEAEAVVDLSPASRVLNHQKRMMAEKHKLCTVKIADNAFSSPDDSDVFGLISRAGAKPTPQHILDFDQLDASPEQAGLAKHIADTCSDLVLPSAPMIRADGDLEAVCRAGIEYRGMKQAWTQEYEDRLQYELELIRSKDFESYFIVVADMVHYAKEHMLVGPSRGSAAGSLACYLARITEIDPIPPKLYFERFIDVSRTDLPDIDLDFPDDKRQMVFDYMANKYGSSNVAQIGTVSKFKPKSALIQVCKALNIPPAATAAVKVAMIERSSADSRANNCLEDTLYTTKPGQEFIKAYPQAAAASIVEGHASHTGVHAAGLLVCNDDITNYAVVDSHGIAHIEKNAAEAIGLLKIDVLGLRTLGILEDANVGVDWYNLPFDDPATYDVFNQGRLCGIFQFEGNALRAISRDIEFETITEIDAVTALARPGPFGGGVTEKYVKRKNGEAYTPIHPLVESHMAETYGLPVYQEQTLAIVREIGKFDWKETSTIRKAMSKRMGKEFFDGYWEKFKVGAASQGIGEKEARTTWETINAMGAWQMNKAHTYSYAVISYWTAYLKAHHPLEFAAANLRSAKDEDSAVELLREMVREGLQYVPFDIDRSQKDWSVQGDTLVGGFMALKGIGESKADKLIAARDGGSMTDKMKEDVAKAANIFSDIFPFSRLYKGLYDSPKDHGIIGDVNKIVDLENIPHRDQRVFIGQLIYKNARNSNEEVNVKKRGGKMETGPLEFVDVRLRDDTGTIGGRVGRFDFERIGRELLETVPEGAHLLVRANFYNDIRYAFISKWKRIDV